MSSKINDVVGAYGAAWLEPDEAVRMQLLETAWSDTGSYQDPTADVTGRGGLSAHIAGFHAQAPGAKILLTSGVDSHHGKLRFTWKMVGADDSVVMEGIDFGELAEDGRLAKIVGFFGAPAAQGKLK
jgi:hypothetical protein